MKTHEMIESKWLRKEDVGKGVRATIRELQKETINSDEGEKQRWVLYFDELPKGLVLGSTTIQQCELACGSDDTDEWIGKQIVLYEDPGVAFRGKLVGGIRVRPVPRRPAPEPQQREVPAVQRPRPGTSAPAPDPKSGPFSDMDDAVPF